MGNRQSLTPIRRAVRILRGPSAAARAMGVTPQTIFGWLNRGYVPTREYALRMAELTGISAADLMALTNGARGPKKGKYAWFPQRTSHVERRSATRTRLVGAQAVSY